MVTLKQVVGLTALAVGSSASGYLVGANQRQQRRQLTPPAGAAAPFRAWFYAGHWYVDQPMVDRLAKRQYTPTSDDKGTPAGTGWTWFDLKSFPLGVRRAPPGDTAEPLEGQQGALFEVTDSGPMGRHNSEVTDFFELLGYLGVVTFMDVKGRTTRGVPPWGTKR